ncbi:uncharacterized protein LOC143816067 [Ranitomeya variabilis]|uniref:uncharacterized protein LOC143816067 n=1 Tax=Ranitomeya variabilis TaxID=490064 RepID=UPI0040577723
MGTRMDSQLGKIKTGTHKTSGVPRSSSKLGKSDILPTRRQEAEDHPKGHGRKESSKLKFKTRNVSAGIFDGMYISSKMGSSSYPDAPIRSSSSRKRSSRCAKQKVQSINRHSSRSDMVAQPGAFVRRSSLEDHSGQRSYDGCQSIRLGSPYGRQSDPRTVVDSRIPEILKPKRAYCSQASSSLLPTIPEELACTNTDRQYDCGVLHQSSGRDKITIPDDYYSSDIESGRESSTIPVGSSYKRRVQYTGGLPQSPFPSSGRMGLRPTHIRSHSQSVGSTNNRSICYQREQKNQEVCITTDGRPTIHTGFPSRPLGLPAGVCLSPYVSTSDSSQEDPGGRSQSNFNCSLLAQEALVFSPKNNVGDRSLGVASGSGTPFSGSISSSKFGDSSLNGLELERELLRERGFSSALIATLLKSRKEVTTKIYTKIWKKFLMFHQQPLGDKAPISAILEFLQKGWELGLAVNTLRVHVSALGALYNSDIAGNRWVARFIRACQRSNPIHIVRIPPWDLNLVLDALTEPPFEPLDSISIKNLTLKTALLLALTSARRVSDIHALSVDPPYLMILQDKIVLKPDPAYLPKVATKFHRTQEIYLPSFYENPASEEERKYHSLDVKRAILEYLDRTQSWRQSRALFISFQNQKKGSGVTKSSIARWIREAIWLAYSAKGVTPPEGIRAHSTRAMATSWAEKADVPIEMICKAATWSSPSTFYKHYRLDLSANASLQFGRSVLSAVVPPS